MLTSLLRFHFYTQHHVARSVMAHNGQGPLIAITSDENALQICIQANLMKE